MALLLQNASVYFLVREDMATVDSFDIFKCFFFAIWALFVIVMI